MVTFSIIGVHTCISICYLCIFIYAKGGGSDTGEKEGLTQGRGRVTLSTVHRERGGKGVTFLLQTGEGV